MIYIIIFGLLSSTFEYQTLEQQNTSDWVKTNFKKQMFSFQLLQSQENDK
jgi:hypothetical protein